MARTGPPEDFHNQPTRHVNIGAGGMPPLAEPPRSAPQPRRTDEQEYGAVDPLGDPFGSPFGEEPEPKPWYRKPVLLGAWLVVVLILIGLIIFGIVELLRPEEGTSPVPGTSSTRNTTTTTTTPPPTTSATTTTSAPPTSSEFEQPPQQPTWEPTRQPTQQPTHKHHLPQLPWVITIPEVPTVITVPPALR